MSLRLQPCDYRDCDRKQKIGLITGQASWLFGHAEAQVPLRLPAGAVKDWV